MTKQELIQRLKDLSFSTSISLHLPEIAIIEYVISNDAEVKYWFDKCFNRPSYSLNTIDEILDEESEMSKLENNVSSQSEEKVSDPNSPSRFSFGKK